MMKLSDIDAYLNNVADHQHLGPTKVSQVTNRLSVLKAAAVDSNDQVTAKHIWCLETILALQRNYIEAFKHMKAGKYYDAWCLLERVEITLVYLDRHLSLTENNSRYQLGFIAEHTPKFQALYPYRLFFSPGVLIHEKRCTICGEVITFRNHCGHKVGEIYNGEHCGREITQASLIELSIVPNPTQKYSVAFQIDPETNERVDQYNYYLVEYAVRGLRQPFDAWDVRFTEMEWPRSEFSKVGRNDPCPCRSGKKFKLCCMRKEIIRTPHVEFDFQKPPPPNLPGLVPPQRR